MVVGRKFADVPYIASRVCGICSASHVITDILAIERIFGVEVTDRTRALRAVSYTHLPHCQARATRRMPRDAEVGRARSKRRGPVAAYRLRRAARCV